MKGPPKMNLINMIKPVDEFQLIYSGIDQQTG